MKIYRSTEYVKDNEREHPWYSLSVINQWDWKSKAVCYGFVGEILIGYSLELNTKTGLDSWKSEDIETLTEDMKQELIGMGYMLTSNTEVSEENA
jgi:hypothetical protein